MTEYRATVRVELVDDRPTYAEVVIESTDLGTRLAGWPMDASQRSSLEAAAQRSEASLDAHVAALGAEMLEAAGMELREHWSSDREVVPAESGGACGSLELTTLVSGDL